MGGNETGRSASGTSAPQNAPSTAVPPDRPVGPRRWRGLGILLGVFLLGVLLGWLLAPRSRCPGQTLGDGTVTGSAQSSRGAGPPGRLGTGKGEGSGGGGSGRASGDTKAGGGGGDATGESADAGGRGAGSGNTPAGSGDGRKHEDAEDTLARELAKYAEGADSTGRAEAAQSGPEVTGRVRMAHDFTYDMTGLPRYPDGVQEVVSSIAYKDPQDASQYHTSVAIVTGDSFDIVVAWYRGHLPRGWQDQTIGDLSQLAQQLTAQNLARTLTSASGDESGDAATAANGTTQVSSDPAARMQIAVFSPPAGTQGQPGVMIAKKGDQPVRVMMKARST